MKKQKMIAWIEETLGVDGSVGHSVQKVIDKINSGDFDEEATNNMGQCENCNELLNEESGFWGTCKCGFWGTCKCGFKGLLYNGICENCYKSREREAVKGENEVEIICNFKDETGEDIHRMMFFPDLSEVGIYISGLLTEINSYKELFRDFNKLQEDLK